MLRLLLCTLVIAALPAAEVPPIPALAQWEADMLKFGTRYAQELAEKREAADLENLINTTTYYDAARVFFQIADYTKDAAWRQAALDALRIYRDRYVAGACAFDPAGHLTFTDGMLMSWKLSGDAASRDAILRLSEKERWAREANPIPTDDPAGTRETAYALKTLLNARAVGGPERARAKVLADSLLLHLDKWFVAKSAGYVKPFFVGLACESLIAWQEATGDPRVLPALRGGLDALWQTMWVPDAEGFRYTNDAKEGDAPAQDLNCLLCPAYAWVWRQTGDPGWLARADAIFAGGVRKGWLGNAKHFDMAYRWTFAYVAWRSQPPLGTGAKPRDAERKDDAKKGAGKPAIAASKPPAADTAPLRATIVAALAKGGLPASATMSVLGERMDVEALAADEQSLTVRTKNGDLKLPWRTVVDADLPALALRARADDTETLAAAWRLAQALRQGDARDAIGRRLLAVDPETLKRIAAP